MDWLKINERTKEMDMEWTSLNIEEVPCRFEKDNIIPIESVARKIHGFKQPFKGPYRETVESVLFKSAHHLHDAIDLRTNCREDRDVGEICTRQAYKLADKDLIFWQRMARYEIDRIADDDIQCNFIIRELLRLITNAERYLVTSDKCLSLRQKELDIISDGINSLMEKEMEVTRDMIKELKLKIQELEKRLERLRVTRPDGQKDIMNKTISESINQSCQVYNKLLLYRDPPEIATEPPKFQRLHWKVWEDNIQTLLRTSMELRESCQQSCRSADECMQEHIHRLFEAWNATNNALSSEVDKNNDRMDKTRAELNAVLYDIQFADQRLLSLRRSGFQEKHPLDLTLWRQKRGYLRPPREQIYDKPNERIECELKASDMRVSWIETDIKKNEEIREELQAKRLLLEKKLDLIAKHLFVDRECCQGLRRTVEQAHPTESLAKRIRFHPTKFPWRWHLLTKGTSTCVCY